jgi:hypothetical protein
MRANPRVESRHPGLPDTQAVVWQIFSPVAVRVARLIGQRPPTQLFAKRIRSVWHGRTEPDLARLW